jgi:glycosyltransferase involved in cell wall biosynthesis
MISSLIEFQQGQNELDITLIALNTGRLCEIAHAAGGVVRVIPESELSGIALTTTLRHELETLDPDVVHSHRYKENLLSYWLARQLHFRCVVTVHGDEPPEGTVARLRIALRRRVSWFLARRVRARIVAVSEDLRAIFGLSSDQCKVIPNAVRIPEAPVTHAATREPPVIGWIGRMVPIKDLPLLMDAFAALPSRFSDARLLLVGDGPERGASERHAKELGIANRVEWTGFVDNPYPLLERMTLFVLPSRHEGLPIALLEAMAAAVPCVVAAVGGIPDAIGDSRAANLIGSRSVAKWTGALERALDRPDETERMGMRAREHVKAHFTLERCAGHYLDLYREVLGR